MIKIRSSEESGHTQFSWLHSRHRFAFGGDSSVIVHQQAGFWADRCAPGQQVTRPLKPPPLMGTNRAWHRDACGMTLAEGDGAALRGESVLDAKALQGVEILLFDLRG